MEINSPTNERIKNWAKLQQKNIGIRVVSF